MGEYIGGVMMAGGVARAMGGPGIDGRATGLWVERE